MHFRVFGVLLYRLVPFRCTSQNHLRKGCANSTVQSGAFSLTNPSVCVPNATSQDDKASTPLPPLTYLIHWVPPRFQAGRQRSSHHHVQSAGAPALHASARGRAIPLPRADADAAPQQDHARPHRFLSAEHACRSPHLPCQGKPLQGEAPMYHFVGFRNLAAHWMLILGTFEGRVQRAAKADDIFYHFKNSRLQKCFACTHLVELFCCDIQSKQMLFSRNNSFSNQVHKPKT